MALEDADGVSRRGLLGRAAAVSVGAALGAPAVGGTAVGAPVTGAVDAVDPRVTLLDALRERLGLTGTKKGCDRGQCGSCTVHVGGRRVLSCLTLVASVRGKEVATIEGLARRGRLHPVQQAFIDSDGFQCGFCTPGQVMSAVALIREGRARTDAEIREGMSGNLCRCGAYANIVDAVRQARHRIGED